MMRTNEPLAEQIISLRIPVSQVEILQAKGIDWIREAIAEKLQRESVIMYEAIAFVDRGFKSREQHNPEYFQDVKDA